MEGAAYSLIPPSQVFGKWLAARLNQPIHAIMDQESVANERRLEKEFSADRDAARAAAAQTLPREQTRLAELRTQYGVLQQLDLAAESQVVAPYR